ncbi:hypothetical protein J5X84_39325 [Streptosporangiaceae bacterium NEAU-GS5]|nr:hypothetical protein [Streptosporangiaceae bacterium NEAU-GS5]
MARRMATSGIILTIALLAVGFILASPLLLDSLQYYGHLDWSKLSNIGQSFDAAGTVITALSFIVIAMSMIYQARMMRITQLQAHRQFHQELLLSQMADADLMDVLSPTALDPRSRQRKRVLLWVNLWVSFWWMNYSSGFLYERELRHLARRELFSSEAGREYWRQNRAGWSRMASRQSRKFTQILNEEFMRVEQDVAADRLVMSGEQPARLDISKVAAASLGVGAALLLWKAVRRLQ